MYAVLAAVCCDPCTGGPDKGTPATECPSGTATSASITISVTATPKAICNVTGWTCASGDDYCPNGIVKNASCETCEFEVPIPTVTSGIGNAMVSVAWPSYTNGTSCFECDHQIESLGDPISDEFTVSLDCTGAGATATFGTPGVDGISGSVTVVECCDDCACGSPYLCSIIEVSVTAQWTKTLSGCPVVSGVTLYDCDGSLVNDDCLGSSLTSTEDYEFVVLTGGTVRMQRTILASQATPRLAPGPYTVISGSCGIPTGADLSVMSLSLIHI